MTYETLPLWRIFNPLSVFVRPGLIFLSVFPKYMTKIRHIVNALRVFSKTSDSPARLAPRRTLMDSEWRGANCVEY